MSAFSEKLFNQRVKQGLTQSDVAKLVPMTQSSYSRIENGFQEPNLSQLKRIAEVLNVSLDYLLDDDTEYYNNQINADIKDQIKFIYEHYISKEKHIDDEEHKKLTMHSNKAILDFAKYLSEKNIPVWIRHVVVPNLNDHKKYLTQLGEFLGKLKNIKALDILPYHDMAVPKYKHLNLKYPLQDVKPLTKEEAINSRNIIIQAIKDVRNK